MMKLRSFSRSGLSAALASALLVPLWPARAANHTVNIVGDSFSPSTLTINAGDSVTWSGLNNSHNVTGSNAGDQSEFCGNGGFGTESSCSHTFTTAGTFPYECTIHASCCGMVGSITVNAVTPPPTPTVSITSPTNGSSFTAPATVEVDANATVSSGTVTNVTFFRGATRIGSATSPPFSATAGGLAAGSYSFTAVATAAGISATSAVVSITVTQPAPPPTPVVNITNPTNGASFTSPATVQIDADASVSSGTVTNVTFFQGTTPIGSATNTPFSVTATNLAVGTYDLTAVATAAGISATSAVVTIVVSAAAPPPTVSIIRPADGAVFAAPVNLQLAADASVTGGTVTNVAFLAGSTALGAATSPPFEVTASGLGAGSYALTAVATAGGISTTSAVVNITVVAPSPTDTTAASPAVAGGLFSFTFTATSGLTYDVQSSSDLANWSVVTNITASSSTVPFSDTFQPSAALYYRVVRQPNP